MNHHCLYTRCNVIIISNIYTYLQTPTPSSFAGQACLCSSCTRAHGCVCPNCPAVSPSVHLCAHGTASHDGLNTPLASTSLDPTWASYIYTTVKVGFVSQCNSTQHILCTRIAIPLHVCKYTGDHRARTATRTCRHNMKVHSLHPFE